MSKLRTLDTANIQGKKVILRLDLNLPFAEGRMTDDTRLVRSLPTIHELLRQGARVIILSHFGRPGGGDDNESFSLAPIAHSMHTYFQVPLLFSGGCVGPAAYQATELLPEGSILVMENLRFHPGEEENNPLFGRQLASLGDFYVNDAFSCSHRAHASIVGIPQYLPSCAGLALEKEVRFLQKFMESPQHPIMAIVGGSKISTKISLLQRLVSQVDILALGGAMANTFLVAQGYGVGASLIEKDHIQTAQTLIEKAQEIGCKILLPTDGYVSQNMTQGQPLFKDVGQLESDDKIFDVGPKTLHIYGEALKSAKMLLWNGPLGVYETPPFHQGSLALARLAATCTQHQGLISIAGGGDTLSLLSQGSLGGLFSYTSTAGGAFLEWVEQGSLIGVEALRG